MRSQVALSTGLCFLVLAYRCMCALECVHVCVCACAHAGLQSSDPFSTPVIDLGYYQGEGVADLHTLREGLRIARRIAAETPLAKYLIEEAAPGPAATSDADLDAFIRKTTCSGNALVGTCR